MELNDTLVPKFVLAPSKIAANALEVGYMTWEVYNALVDFEEDKSDEVKKSSSHAKTGRWPQCYGVTRVPKPAKWRTY